MKPERIFDPSAILAENQGKVPKRCKSACRFESYYLLSYSRDCSISLEQSVSKNLDFPQSVTVVQSWLGSLSPKYNCTPERIYSLERFEIQIPLGDVKSCSSDAGRFAGPTTRGLRQGQGAIVRRLSPLLPKSEDDLLPPWRSARCNDDCIIPIVNAISRAEFDEFTTRFYEDTERTVRDRLPPSLSPSPPSPPLFLCLTVFLSLSLALSSPPGTLIYARRYLCQWIYIPIFIIRNIIARAFIALVEMPSPRRLSAVQPLSTSFFRLVPFSVGSAGPSAGRHARCDLLKLISVVILKRIFITRGKRAHGREARSR